MGTGATEAGTGATGAGAEPEAARETEAKMGLAENVVKSGGL